MQRVEIPDWGHDFTHCYFCYNIQELSKFETFFVTIFFKSTLNVAKKYYLDENNDTNDVFHQIFCGEFTILHYLTIRVIIFRKYNI